MSMFAVGGGCRHPGNAQGAVDGALDDRQAICRVFAISQIRRGRKRAIVTMIGYTVRCCRRAGSNAGEVRPTAVMPIVSAPSHRIEPLPRRQYSGGTGSNFDRIDGPASGRMLELNPIGPGVAALSPRVSGAGLCAPDLTQLVDAVAGGLGFCRPYLTKNR